MRRCTLCIPALNAVAIALALCAAPGRAISDETGAAVSPVAPADAWRLSFTPYAWLPWLDGEMTIKGRTVAVGVDPIQVMEHLERFPFMGYAEARKGPLVLYNDIFYADLGLTAEGVRSRGVRPGLTGTLSAALGVDFEEATVEVGGAYEIAKWASAGGRRTAIDALAGARY